ncbi:MAG: M6 family metalloprotease domain-containing protein, partial [Candidatus Marinimicrobia bacterium]|nr:M6 family metalloprotease domain-containing protein [Candidatus Neomarinimicrobiota bacterium]
MGKYIPFGLLIIMSGSLLAVPASPEPGMIRYPDGRELTVYLRGDENRSWHETEDGHHIIKNTSGQYEYAEVAINGLVKSSGILAHAPGQRGITEQKFVTSLPELIIYPASMQKTGTMTALTPTPTVPFDQTDFPTLGDKKFLLILVEFADRSFTHSAIAFDSLMNNENYTHNDAIGSVRKYYNATSFDRFNPNFDVVGPIELDSGLAYYGKNVGDNKDVNIQLFIREAINKADPLVDYAQYDNDNDGYVDNVYFIYAGYGECFYGADKNTIWPHRWAFIGSQPSLDGKIFYDYSTSMEFYGTSGTTRTSVGVVCHEFGHVCGLPDFYDTDYEDSGGNCGGLGAWDAMAGGSWNDAGKRPPIFNAWSRMYLRWAEPQELIGTENVTLNPVYSHNEARYFFSQTDDEFFMMENRQQSAWDAALPGHGLLIYHIDMNSSGWNNNTLNCNPYRQAFDLEEADGQGNITSSKIDAGDPFPGTSGNSNFLDTGSPNALDWAGQASRSPIRQITETSGVITFYFGDGNVDAATDLVLEPMGYDSIRISWALNDAVDSVIILWSTDPDIGYVNNLTRYEVDDVVAGGEVIYKGLDSVFYHTGLEPGITNYYAIFSFDDSSYVYSDKISGSVTTTSPPFYATDFSSGLPEGWVIFDRVGNGTWSTENPESRNFTSSTSNNGFMIMDSEHMGDIYIDAELITQSFNFALSRSVVLRFEHKLEISSITLARLLYTINDGASWFEVRRWTENTIDPEICELDLTNQIKGSRDVKFKFNFRGTNEKYWCIDDFSIMSALDSGLAAGMHVAETSGSKPFTVHFM